MCQNGSVTHNAPELGCYIPACADCTCDPATRPQGSTSVHGGRFVGPVCVHTGEAGGVDLCDWVVLSNDTECAVHAANDHPVTVTSRNLRFCEVILMVRSGSAPPFTFTPKIYNSFGLNDCPADQWDSISTTTLVQHANALGITAVGAFKNGPRWWTIDSITGGALANPIPLISATFQMRFVAVLTVSALPPPYIPFNVARVATWNYDRASLVYLLNDPTGNTWVMQSYNDQVTEHDLNGLKHKLNLPDGWKYHSQSTGGEALHLHSQNGVSTILRDDIGNAYNLLA